MRPARNNGNGARRLRLLDPREAFVEERPVDLSGVAVAVLGCGSLGGFAAWALAGAGVGRLELADCDQLSLDNTRRHLCGQADVGRAKTESVRAALRARFTHLQVDTHHYCFLEKPDHLGKLIDQCDMTLVAVDQEGPKYVINDILWNRNRAAVFAGIYGGGWGGELIYVERQEDTACYGCAANALGRAGIDLHPAGSPPPYAMPQRSDLGAGRSERHGIAPGRDTLMDWLQADLTSIMPTAALAADLIAARLAARQGHDQRLREFRQHRASAWRWALRHVPAWEVGPWTLQAVQVSGKTACPQRCGHAQPAAA